MGCFNSTCVVSGMPLQGGDKVRIVLLTENSHADAHRACTMNGWWIPRTFPLQAEYNDYGTVENVEGGLSQDLWLSTLKIDVVEKGTGDNSCHDVPVSADMTFEKLLEALWENRVEVTKRVYPFPTELEAKITRKKDQWLPRLQTVQAKLQGLPMSPEYGVTGYLVDELDYGVVRVRWERGNGKLDETAALERAQAKLQSYATVITAGTGGYSHGSPELRVFPKPGKGRHWAVYNSENPEPPTQRVSYAMIREDVWQALLQVQLAPDWGPTVALHEYRADLAALYQKDLEDRRQLDAAEAEIAKAPDDETRKELLAAFRRLHVELEIFGRRAAITDVLDRARDPHRRHLDAWTAVERGDRKAHSTGRSSRLHQQRRRNGVRVASPREPPLHLAALHDKRPAVRGLQGARAVFRGDVEDRRDQRSRTARRGLPMNRDDLEHTERGFVIYGRGTCTREIPWRVLESSIAGDARVWLFVDKGGIDDGGGALHLNLEMTRQLITHLEKFIRDRIQAYGEGVCTYGIKWRLTDEPSESPLCLLAISGQLRGGGPKRDEDGKLWLDREKAKLLQAHLERFLLDSGDPGHWKNNPEYIAVWRTAAPEDPS